MTQTATIEHSVGQRVDVPTGEALLPKTDLFAANFNKTDFLRDAIKERASGSIDMLLDIMHRRLRHQSDPGAESYPTWRAVR